MFLQQIHYGTGLIKKDSLSALKEILVSLIRLTRRTYIVIDALDEIPDVQGGREQLLTLLETISGMPNLHILMTSGDEADIEESTSRDCRFPSLSIFPMRISGTESDMRLFIDRQLEGDRKLNRWPAQIRHEIKESLTRGAEGM
jgi:ankyrin repeat domain-containing protein 50